MQIIFNKSLRGISSIGRFTGRIVPLGWYRGPFIKSRREGRQGMPTHSYTVLVEKENGGYRAHCPALPGCRSYGDTKKEAVNNIKLSISYRLETLMAKGKPIPKDGDLARPVQQRA